VAARPGRTAATAALVLLSALLAYGVQLAPAASPSGSARALATTRVGPETGDSNANGTTGDSNANGTTGDGNGTETPPTVNDIEVTEFRQTGPPRPR
jgi:hypothetical protein